MASEALNAAVQNGSIEKVKQLLDEGAEINLKVDTGGWTALHCAVQNKEEEIVHLLLDRGADPHVRKDNGATPFIVAGIVGSVELLELFLSKGSDINEHDVNGFTAFMETAWYGKEEALRFLYRRGADVNLGRAADEEKRALNKGGGTALMDAAKNGHTTVVKTLVKEMNADVHICDNQGRNALVHALSVTEGKKWDQDKEAIALFLLKHEADVNKRDEYAKTTLILAAERQSQDLVKAIVEKGGVDVNATDKSHKTALSVAVENKNHEIAKILCEHGARTDIEKQNLIASARKRYDCKMVALLQQFGAKAMSSQPQTQWTLPSRRWESKLQQLSKGNCINIGKLQINKNKYFRIQETSQGGVYLGFYDREAVAVKIFRSGTENAECEKTCLEKCRASNHLVKFYGWEERKACLYLCLSLCEQNLEEYLRVTEENATIKSKDILERVFRAVRELHVFGFGHQDLHPSNILIGVYSLVLSLAVECNSFTPDVADNIFLADFDKCRKLVDDDTDIIKEDLKALARLVVYVAMRGKSCFEDLPTQCPVEVADYMELEDLRASLSSFNESIPVSEQLRHLMYHPYFWSRQMKYRFLRDVGNESDIKTRNTKHHNDASDLLKALNCEDDPFQSWMGKIDKEVLASMEDPFSERDKKRKNRPKKNYENCASDLLKLIRHVAEHIKEKEEKVQKIIKEPEDYFLTLFPDLPIYVYQKLRNTSYEKYFPPVQNLSL
ncbi:hypothetical protein lerEdw1_002565 [Lerista edwardsae]|nr:hypothetical protein lerEdw1_002565 [Lerista edwardsae]